MRDPLTSSAPNPAEPEVQSPFRPGALWLLAFCFSALGASALQILGQAHDHGYFQLSFAYVLVGAAAWVDSAWRRIPNKLTYPALMLALLLSFVVAPLLQVLDFRTALIWLGAPSLADAFWGLLFCFVLGILSFMARGLGGGDVKMLFALGPLIGMSRIGPILFNTLIVAAIVGLAQWAMKGTLAARFQVVMRNLTMSLFSAGEVKEVYPFGKSDAPFCLSLLIGMLLYPWISLHQLVMRLID